MRDYEAWVDDGMAIVDLKAYCYEHGKYEVSQYSDIGCPECGNDPDWTTPMYNSEEEVKEIRKKWDKEE